MDAFSTLPTMTMSELHRRAESFANDLAEQLQFINDKFPFPHLTGEGEFNLTQPHVKSYLEQTVADTPFHHKQTFQQIFIRYAASKYAIIPDQPEHPDT